MKLFYWCPMLFGLGLFFLSGCACSQSIDEKMRNDADISQVDIKIC